LPINNIITLTHTLADRGLLNNGMAKSSAFESVML